MNKIDARVNPLGSLGLSEPKYALSPAVAPVFARAADVVALSLSALACALILEARNSELFVSTTIYFGVVYFMIAGRLHLFEMTAIMRPIKSGDRLLSAMAGTVAFVLATGYAFGFVEKIATPWFAVFGATSAGLALAARLGLSLSLEELSRRYVIGRNLVVLGVDQQSRRFLRRFAETKPLMANIMGVFSPEPGSQAMEVEGHPVIGDMDVLLNAVRAHKIDDVVIAMPWSANRETHRLIEELKQLPVNVYLSTDLIGFDFAFRPAFGNYREIPMFEVQQRPISGLAATLKALEDYVLAGALLLLIAPLFALIAVAVKIDSPGPVFFKQKRIGFNNKIFEIYKFRSMRHSEKQEIFVRQAQKNDPRVTRVGRIIRATSLDELPQLFNVLNGTMSLVGPRPHALSHNEEYGRSIRGYFARHRVKPGITGWAQVNGLRGETDRLEKMISRVDYDIYYADNWSLLFDIRILLMTAVTVLFQKTAY